MKEGSEGHREKEMVEKKTIKKKTSKETTVLLF
jgi:hypothetical protein